MPTEQTRKIRITIEDSDFPGETAVVYTERRLYAFREEYEDIIWLLLDNVEEKLRERLE